MMAGAPARPAQGYAWFLFALTALWLLSTGLRFHALAAQGLWSDELFSVSIITQVGQGLPWYHYEPRLFPDLRLADSPLTWKAGENSPPLFELLLWLWTRLFGESDFAVRSLSALLGSLAPVVLCAGLWRPLGGFAAGAVALLLALSPSAVAYAQETRGYALLLLLACWATVRLVRHALLHGAGERNARFAVDVVLYVLLSYTHYTGLLLACALVTVRFVFDGWRRLRLRGYWAFAWVPLLLAPWLYLNWYSMAQTGTGRFGWRDYGWGDVWSLMLPRVAEFFLPGRYTLWTVFVVALVCALWGVHTGPQTKGGAGQVLGLAGAQARVRWVLAAACTAIVGAHFCYGIYTAFHARVWHERYFTAMVPVGLTVLALLLSLADVRAQTLLRSRLLPGAVVLVAAVVSLFVTTTSYHKPWKEEYREASHDIAMRAQDGAVVVATWASNAIYFNYYLRGFMAAAGKHYTLQTVGAEGDLEQGVNALCRRSWAPGAQVVLFQHKMHRLYFDMLNQRCAGVLRLVGEQQFAGVYVNWYEATGAVAVPDAHSSAVGAQ